MKQLTFADVSLIILIIAMAVLLHFRLLKASDKREVRVYHNNQLFGIFPLEEDKIVTITDSFVFRINNHKMQVIKSECPDKRCIRQGASDRLPIICMPNRISIEITDKKKADVMHVLH